MYCPNLPILVPHIRCYIHTSISPIHCYIHTPHSSLVSFPIHVLLHTHPTSPPHFLSHRCCYIHAPNSPLISCPTHMLLHTCPYFSNSVFVPHICFATYAPPPLPLISCPIHVLLHNAPYFSPHFLSHTFVARYIP